MFILAVQKFCVEELWRRGFIFATGQGDVYADADINDDESVLNIQHLSKNKYFQNIYTYSFI